MFKVVKILLKLTTVTPFSREPNYVYLVRSVYTYLFLFLSIVLCAKFALDNKHITERCIAFTFAMSSLNGIVKVTVERYNRRNIDEIIDVIKRETKGGFAETTRKIARFYFNMILIIVATWNVYPLIDNKKRSTIPIWFPFQIDNTLNYCVGYVFVLGIFFYQSTIHFSTECVVMLAVAEISTSVDTLKEQAEEFGERLHHKKLSDDSIIKPDPELKRVINLFFKKHIEIIRLTNIVTGMTKIIFLVQVVQSILMSCTFAYAVSKMTTPEEVIKFMPTILTIFWQLFIFCYYGEILKDKLEGIHYYLFWKDWSCAPLQIKKSILLNLCYTSKSIKFNENLVFPMSIITFVQALRESVSYYMFLRTVTKN